MTATDREEVKQSRRSSRDVREDKQLSGYHHRIIRESLKAQEEEEEEVEAGEIFN